MKTTIPQQLKEARIASGKNIEEISQALNIRKQYLIALEEGNYEDLPGRVYARGYFKLYTRYLGITIKATQHHTMAIPPAPPYRIPIQKKYQIYLVMFSILMLALTMLLYQLLNTPHHTVTYYKNFMLADCLQNEAGLKPVEG